MTRATAPPMADSQRRRTMVELVHILCEKDVTDKYLPDEHIVRNSIFFFRQKNACTEFGEMFFGFVCQFQEEKKVEILCHFFHCHCDDCQVVGKKICMFR